jgi:hypothetical protein
VVEFSYQRIFLLEETCEMPRKSADSNNAIRVATTQRPPLIPPKFLTSAERTIFIELAAQNQHLTPTHAPLLALYAQGVLKTSQMSREADINAWTKVGRMSLALARSLRLTVQSSTRPEKVSGQRRDQQQRELAQQMRNYRADDDDDEA